MKIQKLIEKFELEEDKPYNAPMESGFLRLDDCENPPPNNTNYDRQSVTYSI